MNCCRDGCTSTLEDSKYLNPVCTSISLLLISGNSSCPNLTLSSVILLVLCLLPNPRWSRTFLQWLQTTSVATTLLLQLLLEWRESLVFTCPSLSLPEGWQSNQQSPQQSHRLHKASLIMPAKAACSSGHHVSSKEVSFNHIAIKCIWAGVLFWMLHEYGLNAFPPSLHSLHNCIVLLYRGTLWH